MFVAIQKNKIGEHLEEVTNEGITSTIVVPEYSDHKAIIAETKEELEQNSFIAYDRIEEYDFAVMYNGVIYVSEEELIEAKQQYVRQIRNGYLTKYVDPVVSNPLRWNDMSKEEQQTYADYRTYLLTYTDTESWYEQLPLTYDAWIESK